MELDFGKYKGLRIDDPEVPTKYLEWLRDSNVERVRAIEAELERREQAAEADTTYVERLIAAGYRTMAEEYGHDPDALQVIGGAREILNRLLATYFDEQAEIERQRQTKEQREAIDRRNRRYAEQILGDDDAEAEDVAWARQILGHP